MTTRDTHKILRGLIDQYHARNDDPALNVSSADRAFGRVQRSLLEERGEAPQVEECLALLAYAHAYATARCGVVQPRCHPDIDHERFEGERAAARKAAG